MSSYQLLATPRVHGRIDANVCRSWLGPLAAGTHARVNAQIVKISIQRQLRVRNRGFVITGHIEFGVQFSAAEPVQQPDKWPRPFLTELRRNCGEGRRLFRFEIEQHCTAGRVSAGFYAPACGNISSGKITNRQTIDLQTIAVHFYERARISNFDAGKGGTADIGLETYLARTIQD